MLAEYSWVLCLDSISDRREAGIPSNKDLESQKRSQQLWTLRPNQIAYDYKNTVVNEWLCKYRLALVSNVM